MKILITCDPEIPVPPKLYGGIERIVDLLVKACVEKGHNVTLCANPLSDVPCKLIKWKGSKSQSLKDTLKNTWLLTSLVSKEKFDIVHSYSRLAYMSAIMPFSTPKIMSYQREPSLSQVKKAVTLSKKGSMVFTGCSNYISNKIKSVAEAHTIYNCVPIENYDGTTDIKDDAPLVFLGRIEEVKGAHIAIKVAQETEKRLIIAGNIPENKIEYYDQKIKPFLNDRIVYIGPVNDEKKNEILGKALAFLMPVQWNEPFGIVMAEAMACGTPVLGFRYGSIPEVVEDGVNGYVCENISEMCEAVKKANTLNRNQIRKIAEQKYSNVKVTGDYLSLYTRILKKKNEYNK